MPLREKIAVCSEDHMKQTNTLCGQKAKRFFLNHKYIPFPLSLKGFSVIESLIKKRVKLSVALQRGAFE
jgi:hypothetical protein